MKYVDVHAHLDDKKFDKIREKVISRFIAKDIFVINNGLNKETNRSTLSLSSSYKNIFASLGVYPKYAEVMTKNEIKEELRFMKKNVNNIVSIGEIGLDYYEDNFNKKKQKEVFVSLLNLAKEFNLPVIIHSRRAEEDVLDILGNYDLKVVLHCFGIYDEKLINKAIDSGYYFSIPPLVNISNRFKKIVKFVPEKFLLLETDSPYMGPFGAKTINEPINILYTLKVIKEIKGKDLSKLILKTTKKLFKL